MARHWPFRRILGSEKWERSGYWWMLSKCTGNNTPDPGGENIHTYMQVYIGVAVTTYTLRGTSLLAYLADRSPGFRRLSTSSVGRG